MSFAFFDTCSRQPDDANAGFVMAEKMKPVRKRVERILAAAARLKAPVLSTTCLGIQRCNPGMCARTACATTAQDAAATSAKGVETTAFVAMNATPSDVADALSCRNILLERLSCKTADDNVRHRTYDVFGVNKNTATIVRALGERRWLVFGAGFEHCLVSAVEGLRALGLQVTVLEDGCIHGGRSIPSTFLRTFERIKAFGAEWRSFEAVFAENSVSLQIEMRPRPAPRMAAGEAPMIRSVQTVSP